MPPQIRLLGGVELDRDGVRVPIESGRVDSLLGFLLLHRETAQTRRHVAFQLWPDSSETQARTNLRHLLHILRRTLPEADESSTSLRVRCDGRADGRWELDVSTFDTALARASEADPATSERLLRSAVELYRGDLVPGCYDEWLLPERENYRRRYCQALRRLVAMHDPSDDAPQTLVYAEELLFADPLDEETYRLLMRLYYARGDRAAHCASTTGVCVCPPARAGRRAFRGDPSRVRRAPRPAGRHRRRPGWARHRAVRGASARAPTADCAVAYRGGRQPLPRPGDPGKRASANPGSSRSSRHGAATRARRPRRPGRTRLKDRFRTGRSRRGCAPHPSAAAWNGLTGSG